MTLPPKTSEPGSRSGLILFVLDAIGVTSGHDQGLLYDEHLPCLDVISGDQPVGVDSA